MACGDSGILRGVTTKTDVVAQMSRCQGASCAVPTWAVVTRDVVSSSPSDWLTCAWAIMEVHELETPGRPQRLMCSWVLTARHALQIQVSEVGRGDAVA